MNCRKLRIAWSVGCGMLCRLLIALWIRSHRYYDIFATNSPNPRLIIESVPGSFIISTAPAYDHQSRTIRHGWERFEMSRFREVGFRLPTYTGLGYVVRKNYFQMKYSWPVSLGLLILALVWVRPSRFGRRFSLRTLLIAATVVAVGLGLIVATSS
jgi:hypothetical protein